MHTRIHLCRLNGKSCARTAILMTRQSSYNQYGIFQLLLIEADKNLDLKGLREAYEETHFGTPWDNLLHLSVAQKLFKLELIKICVEALYFRSTYSYHFRVVKYTFLKNIPNSETTTPVQIDIRLNTSPGRG